MEQRLQPIKFSKRIIKQSWDYSEIEFDVEKDELKFIFHLDDEGSAYLLLQTEMTEDNKKKLLEWATIIAQEMDNLQNGTVS